MPDWVSCQDSLPDALALIRPTMLRGVGVNVGLADALALIRLIGRHGGLPYEGTKHCGIVGWISDSASTDPFLVKTTKHIFYQAAI